MGKAFLIFPVALLHKCMLLPWTLKAFEFVTLGLLLLLLSHVWHHRRQPTRLLCPWDSPGKNTGVGCHFLLQCMRACKVTSVVSDSSQPHGLQHTRLVHPWDFPGKSTGVGCHCLLQNYSWGALKDNMMSTLKKYFQLLTKLKTV